MGYLCNLKTCAQCQRQRPAPEVRTGICWDCQMENGGSAAPRPVEVLVNGQVIGRATKLTVTIDPAKPGADRTAVKVYVPHDNGALSIEDL